MYDLLKEYEMVSVQDLYTLLGKSSSYVDQKWGWMDLQGSQIRRVRDGYILELPKVTSLD
jgi:biotin operon repressor